MEQYASMFVAYKHDSGTAFIVICPFLNLYGVFVLFISKSCWEIEKCLLTIEEAAAYSNIGINKLRDLTNDEACPFVLHVSANKRLIKRKAFEKFIDNSYSL